eukprot:1811717-Pyramimonas_sp.AAC.2
MSQKTLEKIVVCPGKTLEQDVSKCPYIKQKFALEDLPSQLGGKCKVRASAPPRANAKHLSSGIRHSSTLRTLHFCCDRLGTRLVQ